MDAHVRQLEDIRQRRLELLRRIRLIAKEEPLKKQMILIKSIPGIGEITAIRFLSEIIDIHRFKNADHLAAFMGIIPMCHKSGNDKAEDNGSITQRANRLLRCALIEVAWVAVTRDPALALAFENYCKRMKKTAAIVKIARKLVNRIFFVLKHQTTYVQAKN